MIKVGSLVRYAPDPSTVFKWEGRHAIDVRSDPGVVIEKIKQSYSHTRRYKVRWNSGTVTDEWVTHLLNYDKLNTG